MGLFDGLAEKAFEYAKGAYDRSIKVEGMIENLLRGAQTFELRISAGYEDFKRAMEERLHRQDQDTKAYFRDIETRMRELESRTAKTEGVLAGAFTDVLGAHVRDRDGSMLKDSSGTTVSQVLVKGPTEKNSA